MKLIEIDGTPRIIQTNNQDLETTTTKKDGLNRRTSLKPLVETTVAFRRHGVEPVAASVTSFSQICTKLHDLHLKM